MPQEHIGLFDTPPSRRELQLALGALALLFAALLLVLPVRDTRSVEIVAFTPVVDAILATGELIIATMLYAQAAIFRSRALAVLASGFLFIALLLVPHALTFPGAFAPDGLLGAGFSVPAWIMVFRRFGFPISVILYVLVLNAEATKSTDAAQSSIKLILWPPIAVLLAASAATLAIRGGSILPPIHMHGWGANQLHLSSLMIMVAIVSLIAIILLLYRWKSRLDVWILVALVGWIVQVSLNLVIDAHFTVGFYCLYLIAFVCHFLVLFALIEEFSRLYVRLALSMAARDRERETRMLSMDAVAAAISHEVGQPLTAVSLNARAGLNSLTRSPPDLDMVARSLRETIYAGQRTFDVIKGIKATFVREAEAVTEFRLGDLIRETFSLLGKEFAARRISIELKLDDEQPSIFASRIQIQRVLVNLVSYGAETVYGAGGRSRNIVIRSTTLDHQNVLIEITDSGVSLTTGQIDHIFDPFFATKAAGTSFGLSLSRSIIDEHGGRLWASQGDAGGTTFHLTLPRRGMLA